MGLSLGIIAYYVYSDFDSLSDVEVISTSIVQWPMFISITVFAMEATGIAMSLENNMETPQNFLGFTGVLSKAMIVVTTLYATMGIFGYMTYGSKTSSNITFGIPKKL